jgi:GGDEF domain-containing protein
MDARDSATPPDERLPRAARAAHELSDLVWGYLHDELGQAHADLGQVAELSRRLADVSSTIALLASRGPSRSAPPPSPEAPAPEPSPPEPAPLEPPEASPAGRIEIHDARTSEETSAQPSAWISSIGRRLERYNEDRLPFAVLLIEVPGIDRLAHAESAHELARLVALVERALGQELRPADLLTQETRGRYWLVTPETDSLGARVLAERLARTVRGTALHRGVGLEVAIGIAVCPDDGLDASALAAHADVGVYAARAAGRSVAPDDDPAA